MAILASGAFLLVSGLCLMASTENADDLFSTGILMTVLSPYPITAGRIPFARSSSLVQFLKLSRTTRSYVSRITAVERTPSIFPAEFLT